MFVLQVYQALIWTIGRQLLDIQISTLAFTGIISLKILYPQAATYFNLPLYLKLSPKPLAGHFVNLYKPADLFALELLSHKLLRKLDSLATIYILHTN